MLAEVPAALLFLGGCHHRRSMRTELRHASHVLVSYVVTSARTTGALREGQNAANITITY
jgi:hypothetical protein